MLTVAWGGVTAFELGDGQVIYGCAFELLPTNTMRDAKQMLRGVLGQPVRRISATKFEILDGSLVLTGILGCDRAKLLPFRDELVRSYQSTMLPAGPELI